jgi:hypothetical protein
MPSAPPTLPVTVLVGRNNGLGESFLIDHWDSAPSVQQLSAIADSPVRQQLAAELAKNVAVLIYAPSDPAGPSRAEDRVKSLVSRGIEDERIGMSMITLDRNDPAEQLLCRFMGLRPDSPDTLCVAFGRGKLMAPPLVGDEIDEEHIEQLVTMVRQACSCSMPLATMGVDLPLVWPDSVDSTVILMDQELELSELDAEVRNMLASKAAVVLNADPLVVPIPTGSQSAAQLPVAPVTTNHFAAIAAGLVGLLGIAMAVALARRRSSPVDSAR